MTAIHRTVALACFLTGIGLALCAVVATHIWRRDGVTGGELFWAGSDLVAHPERYVRPDRVSMVRRLNLIGICLFLSGVFIVLGATLWALAAAVCGQAPA